MTERDWLMPIVADMLKARTAAENSALCEEAGVSFAPVAEVEDLFDDPHLNGSAGLLDVTLSDGSRTRLPKLPVQLDAHDLALRREAPGFGEHSREILSMLGLDEREIADLEVRRIVAGADAAH